MIVELSRGLLIFLVCVRVVCRRRFPWQEKWPGRKPHCFLIPSMPFGLCTFFSHRICSSYLEILWSVLFIIAFSLYTFVFLLHVVFPVAAAVFGPEMTAFQSLFEGGSRVGFVRSCYVERL